MRESIGGPSNEVIALHQETRASDYWTPVDRIVEGAARRYRKRPRDLTGKKRDHSISRPRHIAIWLSSRLTQHSKLELARFFHRDPAAIGYAMRVVEHRMATSARFAAEVRAVALLIDLPKPADLFAISEPRCTKAAHRADGPPVSDTPLTLVETA
jgi:hypothetical protein